MGRTYQRGNIWWIQYYGQGQLFRESTRSNLKSAATSLLKLREGEIGQGRLPALRAERTTFEELAELFLQDYHINGRKTLQRAQELAARLRKTFGRFRACRITSKHIRDYIARRQSEGLANGTINRELAALKRMFRLASQQTPPLVITTPHIPHLQENNVRQGFFTEDEFKVLRGALPDHVKVPLIIAYWTGMRSGEVLRLRWDQLDLERGLLRLEPGTTKNNQGRLDSIGQGSDRSIVAVEAGNATGATQRVSGYVITGESGCDKFLGSDGKSLRAGWTQGKDFSRPAANGYSKYGEGWD